MLSFIRSVCGFIDFKKVTKNYFKLTHISIINLIVNFEILSLNLTSYKILKTTEYPSIKGQY